MFSLEARLEDMGINVDELEVAIREAMRTAMAGLATGAKNEWIRLAQQNLRSSRADYIAGLQKADSFKTDIIAGEPVYTITLVGWLANSVESGMASFDMKLRLATSPKAKTAKDGHKYMIIPFRHPGSAGEGANIMYTGKAKAEDMMSRLRAAASSAVTIPTGTPTSIFKMQRTSSGDVMRGKVSKIPSSADVHRYLQGMTRYQDPQEGRTPAGKQRGSAQNMTFRVMSEKSDGWIHPGLEARNLLNGVERYVDREMDRMADVVMGVLG